MLQSIGKAAKCLKILSSTEVCSNSFTTQGQDILPQSLLTSLPLLQEHGIKHSISTTFKLKLANINVQCT